MFKYCVWYLLNDTHIINNKIAHNSKILKTSSFPGHITIKHTLDRKQAENIFDEYSKKEKPFFDFTTSLYNLLRENRTFFLTYF